MHMTGLKKMVEMRGGMDRIHFYLRMKLHRSVSPQRLSLAVRNLPITRLSFLPELTFWARLTKRAVRFSLLKDLTTQLMTETPTSRLTISCSTGSRPRQRYQPGL